MNRLPAIPVIDLRDGGPPRHAELNTDRARSLRDACLAFFPRAAMPLMPALDWASQRWLKRSRSPYLPEIAQIASTLEFSGVWLLNASYQWGCTARACEEDGVPWLIRTLDWPFHGLGRHAEVARMRGAVGDFFSVTWPGYGKRNQQQPHRHRRIQSHHQRTALQHIAQGDEEQQPHRIPNLRRRCYKTRMPSIRMIGPTNLLQQRLVVIHRRNPHRTRQPQKWQRSLRSWVRLLGHRR